MSHLPAPCLEESSSVARINSFCKVLHTSIVTIKTERHYIEGNISSSVLLKSHQKVFLKLGEESNIVLQLAKTLATTSWLAATRLAAVAAVQPLLEHLHPFYTLLSCHSLCPSSPPLFTPPTFQPPLSILPLFSSIHSTYPSFMKPLGVRDVRPPPGGGETCLENVGPASISRRSPSAGIGHMAASGFTRVCEDNTQPRHVSLHSVCNVFPPRQGRKEEGREGGRKEGEKAAQ